MKKIYTVLAIAVTGFAFAQSTAKIGVNTSTPSATLDIQPTATNAATSATTVEGVLVPRVSRLRAANMGTAVPESTLVYVNSIADGTLAGTTVNVNETGFYYFKNNVWTKVGGSGGTATPEGTFTRNIRIDPSSTITIGDNDYMVHATFNGNVTVNLPTSPALGRTVCIFLESANGTSTMVPVPIGGYNYLNGTTSNCFIWNGANWLSTVGG